MMGPNRSIKIPECLMADEKASSWGSKRRDSNIDTNDTESHENVNFPRHSQRTLSRLVPGEWNQNRSPLLIHYPQDSRAGFFAGILLSSVGNAWMTGRMARGNARCGEHFDTWSLCGGMTKWSSRFWWAHWSRTIIGSVLRWWIIAGGYSESVKGRISTTGPSPKEYVLSR